MESTNFMIKSQMIENWSNLQILIGYGLVTDDEEYLLFLNGVLDSMISYITSDETEEE